MGESTLLTALSMENHHHPSTLLSMEPTGAPLSMPPFHDDTFDRETLPITLSGPPDINLPLSSERSPPPPWNPSEILDLHHPKSSTSRKCARRGDSIWGSWFFFNFYFKPALNDKAKKEKVAVADKSDLKLDVFLVQHDMENMYMWVFKERPDNALGKMQLRSYMNGHSRPGEPQFPFGVDRGFIRSHRMQRKHYRGLSNPQCIHGIEIVSSPDLSTAPDSDRRKWVELTGRDLNFTIPSHASDFGTWRHLPTAELDLERPSPPPPRSNPQHSRKSPNCSNSMNNLPTTGDGMDIISPPLCGNKRRKESSPLGMEEDTNSLLCLEAPHVSEPHWVSEFTGVMRAHASSGPVTAAKTIYEDDEGYLIMVSLPFSDLQRVKVSWRNTLTHGIVKILCASTGRMPCIKRHDRTFKLTDPNPEHCPPGDFVREIPLATRIPEDAKLEAYYDESGTILEIMVPKHREGPEEHEVQVCLRPHLPANDLLLT